ncbi:MAG: sugar O-acyltransferase (sialic acid O-acetyltransferase NeuD family) [Sphingobacteriales bacterium]|jgi:sugar O-acyltransferase (sialic acid O-acetyltransferase NeuD family)
MKILGIIGAGHLGLQIAHFAINDGHYKQVVFFDDFATSTEIEGHKILGKLAKIPDSFKSNKFDELFIGIGYKHMNFRSEVYDIFKGKIPFGKIIHSSCWVDKTAIIEDGVIIYPNSTIDARVKVGQNVLVNLGSTISHDSEIGSHSFLSPQVAIAGFCSIGDKSILGINCTVIDNVKIIGCTQIGGGSVVIKNIESTGTYVGNPARKLKK